MKTPEFVRQAERETTLVDALYLARHALALHSGVTVQVDGEQWPLDFTQELTKIDAALRTAGINPTKSGHSRA
ncbi:hypothetical protein VSR69_39400 [Paraburkholderia phytofirmans]